MSFLFGKPKAPPAAITPDYSALFGPQVKQQTAASQFGLGEAQKNLPQAREAMQGPLSFWNKILSGDRGAVSSALGPQMDASSEASSAALRRISETAPRGGSRTLMEGDQPLSVVSDMNRNMLGLRTQAAGQVTGIGEALGSLGSSEMGQSTSANNSALQALLQQYKSGVDIQSQTNQQNSQTASGLGQSAALLALLLM